MSIVLLSVEYLPYVQHARVQQRPVQSEDWTRYWIRRHRRCENIGLEDIVKLYLGYLKLNIILLNMIVKPTNAGSSKIKLKIPQTCLIFSFSPTVRSHFLPSFVQS